MISKGRSENTIRAYRADLNGLLDHSGECSADDFEVHAASYLNEIRSDVSPKTTRRKLGTFRGFGRFLGIDNCLSEYKAPTPARAVPSPITGGVPALVKMYDYARTHENAELAALVALCGFEGLRISEALECKQSDFDFTKMQLTVRGKGDKTRVIPLLEHAFQRIAPAYARASKGDGKLIHYSNRGARKAVKRIALKAGIAEDVSSHQMRSTFATAAFKKSKDLRLVQEWLGHASSQTTEVYTHVDMDDMRESGDIIDG